MELVLEHVGGVGNVEGAVRAGAGGLGREGHAGLDDLAERVAMWRSRQKIGVDATLDDACTELILNDFRVVRYESSQFKQIHRQSMKIVVNHRLGCPVYVGGETENRLLIPNMRFSSQF